MSDQLTGDPDFDALLTECLKVLKVKGQDYTIGSTDRLANFRKVAEFTGLPMDQVWAVYFAKHVFAIFAYVKGKTESEPIEGRMVDAVNYLLLGHKLFKEMKPTPGACTDECKKPGISHCAKCRAPHHCNGEGLCFSCFSGAK